MIILFALLAGVALGAGVAGLLLTLRWQKQVEEIRISLDDIASKHQQKQEENHNLKQQVADLRFALNQAQNELNQLKNN
ncbi:MAG: hypothetical protein RL217_530 [Pseudomonadota bacterium]|jgi:predicted nuclease with TOPRIM domain